MVVKCFEVDFSELAREPLFCLSQQFHKSKKEINNLHNFLNAKVRDYCDIVSGFAFSSNDYEAEGKISKDWRF